MSSNYLREGDTVTLNKDIPNKPTMMVYQIKKDKDPNKGPFNQLVGIECIWWTKNQELQSKIFNFKDLEKLEDE